MIDQFGDQEALAASFLACSPRPAYLTCPQTQKQLREEPSGQLIIGENSERSESNIRISPAPRTTQDSPEEVQGNQCLLQIPGEWLFLP